MSMMNAADSQTTSVGIIEIMVTHALVHGMEHPACVSVARTRYGSCPEPMSGTKIRYPPLLTFGQRPARGSMQEEDGTRRTLVSAIHVACKDANGRHESGHSSSVFYAPSATWANVFNHYLSGRPTLKAVNSRSVSRLLLRSPCGSIQKVE